MTRRERLIAIALRTYENHDQGLFIDNMPDTILGNEYTNEIAVTSNVILTRQYNANIERINVLNYNKNIQ